LFVGCVVVLPHFRLPGTDCRSELFHARNTVSADHRAVNEGNLVALPARPALMSRSATDLGPVDANARFDHMTLLLKRNSQQESALVSLLGAQQDPHSAMYHQ
jgi:hypothetical protein